jgi:U6 snRNA-associated Sm-like protein LSm7
MSKQQSILTLASSIDKTVYVTFTGGRSLKGTLKGYDELVNLVLDDTVEFISEPSGATRERKLGLIVGRGTQVCTVEPGEGREEIENPFEDEEEA